MLELEGVNFCVIFVEHIRQLIMSWAQWQYIMKILKIKNFLGGLFWLPRHRPLSHWQLLVSSLRSEKSRWPQDRYLNYLKAVHQLCWVLPIKTEVVAPKVATATLLLGTPRCQLMPILTSLGDNTSALEDRNNIDENADKRNLFCLQVVQLDLGSRQWTLVKTQLSK